MALAINERFLLGKSNEWVDCSMYLMTVLVKNKRKLWGGVMHMGELSFPLVHAFQENI